jgi:hypothetical protein
VPVEIANAPQNRTVDAIQIEDAIAEQMGLHAAPTDAAAVVNFASKLEQALFESAFLSLTLFFI